MLDGFEHFGLGLGERGGKGVQILEAAHGAQAFERAHQQAAPNQRANRPQHRPELIDFIWLVPRHSASLPLCVASLHPTDLVTLQILMAAPCTRATVAKT